METIFVTIRIDFERVSETSYTHDEADVAQMVCNRANSHNHTIEQGVRIDNIEFVDFNQ